MDAQLPPDPWPGTLLAERYRVEARLGNGGMGVVYRGQDETLGRHVAIKLMLLDPRLTEQQYVELVKLFRREASTSAQLQDANTVRLYDFGVANGGAPYLVMELLKGEDLGEHLQREGPLPPAQVLTIFTQLLRGLAAVHARKIIHRDLKPSNVFLARDDHAGVTAKLMDLGIARPVDATRLAGTRGVVGTFQYIAPECWQGRDADAKSDLYAVGIMLVECLTGRLPYVCTTSEAISWMYAHLETQPKRLVELVPGLPHARAFQPLLDDLLAKQPAKRPKDAHAVIAALGEIEQKIKQVEFSKTVASVPPPSALGVSRALKHTAVVTSGDPSRRTLRASVRLWSSVVAAALVLSALGLGVASKEQNHAEPQSSASPMTTAPPAEVPAAGPSARGDVPPAAERTRQDTSALMAASRPRRLGAATPVSSAPPRAAEELVEARSHEGSRYEISVAGTVWDRQTRLTWQRFLPPTYAGCTSKYGWSGARGGACSWEGAKNYCAQLRLDGGGWRLPTHEELGSIVDGTRTDPSIDVAAFPKTPSDWFWSSSPRTGWYGGAWRVAFSSGFSGSSDTDISNRVRCVR